MTQTNSIMFVHASYVPIVAPYSRHMPQRAVAIINVRRTTTINGWAQRLGLLLCVLSGALAPKILASEAIKVNAPLSATDTRYQYPNDLLQKIIDVTTDDFGPAHIEVSYRKEARQRALSSLIKGADLHIMAEAPKPSWDQQLLSVKIPIRKGLQGYRAFLIHTDSQAALQRVQTLDDLIALPTGSGAQWSTLIALQHAGFQVVTSNSYDGLFKMLASKRFITFARGINEAYQELELKKVQHLNLMVDPSLLLYIPLATYFYVTPTQPVLQKRIETGLLRLIASGEFDHHFFKSHCPDLLQAALSTRKLIRIDNPNISRDQLSKEPEHWLDITQDFQATCARYTREGNTNKALTTPELPQTSK